ncbi:N-acetylmuramoyl-L-alanine amidase [Tateyamaria sp. SN3-11]|uniref:N-acetylmuramoyl-L-alanine amidase n=1 Tax=Tateyamaria sp. SN3-11 TaxID=3092147 RepID=UPI0039E930DC
MGTPTKYHFDLPASGRPRPFGIKEEWYPGVEDHWADSTSSRRYDSLLGVRGVVIHATAGGSSSGAMSVMKAHKASWHWLIPDENEAQHGDFVWACAPERRAAWHVRNSQSHPMLWSGNRFINHWTVGIEVVNQQVPTDSFSDWQVAATAEIVRYCWAKYPNLKHVFSHAMVDPTRRTDPGTHFPWDDFSKAVLNGPVPKAHPKIASATPMSQLTAGGSQDDCCMIT